MADIAFTQAVVAVNAAAERAFRIVQMHTAQILKTDNPFKISEGFFTLFGATQVVAGGEGVAGINAHADARFIFHAIDDGCQMFKLKPQVTALAGGVFNDRRHAFGFGQRDVNGLGNARQAFVFWNLLQMTTRMKIEQRQAELLAAGEFINKGIVMIAA